MQRHDFNLGLICSCLGKYLQLDLQSLKRQLIYLTWVCEFEGNKKEVAEQETMGKKTKCFQNIDINSNVAKGTCNNENLHNHVFCQMIPKRIEFPRKNLTYLPSPLALF